MIVAAVCAAVLTLSTPSTTVIDTWQYITATAGDCLQPITVRLVDDAGPDRAAYYTVDGTVTIARRYLIRVILLHEFAHHVAWSCGGPMTEVFAGRYAWRNLRRSTTLCRT